MTERSPHSELSVADALAVLEDFVDGSRSSHEKKLVAACAISALGRLEEQLEATQKVVDAARVVIEKEGLHGHEDDEDYWRSKKPYWIADLRRSLSYPVSRQDQ